MNYDNLKNGNMGGDYNNLFIDDNYIKWLDNQDYIVSCSLNDNNSNDINKLYLLWKILSDYSIDNGYDSIDTDSVSYALEYNDNTFIIGKDRKDTIFATKVNITDNSFIKYDKLKEYNNKKEEKSKIKTKSTKH